MSCYCVCARQYLKHQEEIQEQSYSVVYKKDSDEKHLYSQYELLDKFKGITLYDVKQTRKHASNDMAGMPIEHGHYSRKKLSDAQINHFLDFCSMEESCKMLLVELHLKDYQLEGQQKF